MSGYREPSSPAEAALRARAARLPQLTLKIAPQQLLFRRGFWWGGAVWGTLIAIVACAAMGLGLTWWLADLPNAWICAWGLPAVWLLITIAIVIGTSLPRREVIEKTLEPRTDVILRRELFGASGSAAVSVRSGLRMRHVAELSGLTAPQLAEAKGLALALAAWLGVALVEIESRDTWRSLNEADRAARVPIGTEPRDLGRAKPSETKWEAADVAVAALEILQNV